MRRLGTAPRKSFKRRISTLSSLINCPLFSRVRPGLRQDVEQAPHAMRTVWLALLCLIVLATTVVVKIISPYANTNVSRDEPSAKAEVSRETTSVALSSENLTPETKIQNDPSTKADKLEVSNTNEPGPEVKSVKSVSIVSPSTEPKQKVERIVSRHWHDPFDKRSAAVQPPAKRKFSKTSTNRPRSLVTVRDRGLDPPPRRAYSAFD